MKSIKNLMSAVAVVALLGLPTAVLAHDQWLLPSATSVEAAANPERPVYVTVDAAVSNALFYADHNAMRLTGLVITGPDGAPVEAENLSTGKLRSTFDVKLAKPGTYRVAVVNSGVSATYIKNGKEVRFRGNEETFAKDVPADAEGLKVSRSIGRVETFITSGKPSELALVGQGLELVPLQPTTDLVVGEAARFRILMDGKPASGLSVKIVPGGVKFRGALKDQRVKTDANGEFTVTWELAGPVWLNTSFPPRPDAEDDHDAPKPGAGGPGGQSGGQGGGQSGGPGGGRPMGDMPARRLSYAATFEVSAD